MQNPNGDTLISEQDQKPAGTEMNTPPAKESSDPVEELKNQVAREQARASTALKEKDDAERRARDERIARIKAEKALNAAIKGDGESSPPSGVPSANEDFEAEQVRLQAEKGIVVMIAGNSQYNDLLAKDQTLKEVLLKNPLSLISEYIDSEDAVDQVKKYLEGRLQMLSDASKPPSEPAKDIAAPAKTDEVRVAGITLEQAKAMSPSEWAKLPAEVRSKLMGSS